MAVRCAVFASGSGSNFQALLDRRAAGDLHIDFVLMIGNNSGAKAFDRARAAGIKTIHTAPSHFENGDGGGETAYTEYLRGILKEAEVELIILAGYMKMLPPMIVREYRNKIINIHPALLPSFGGKGMYGMNVHRAVLEYGAKVTGVTVHFVDEEYDHGPVISQKVVPVMDDDDERTLAARVLEAEHDCFWRAIEDVGGGGWKWWVGGSLE